ncbi:hypothetical protein J3459_015925 [Metarhizium acridum]|nr:hypothetical protein J3459_015925 [Metarhizium acridum]
MHFTALTIKAAVALAAPATAISMEKRQGQSWDKAALAETERLCFHSSLDEFATAKNSSGRNPNFDWSTDGCTAAPNNPTGQADFFPSCERHDFCYHTFKRQGRFYSKIKQRIDDIFEKDLRDACRGKGWDTWLKVLSYLNFWSAIAGAGTDCGNSPQTYRAFVHEFGHLETALDVTPEGSLIDDCSDWYTWYGTGRWTYAKVRFCFPQSANGTSLSVFQQKSMYYWGGAWYSGRPSPATINGTLGSAEFGVLHFNAESNGDFMSISKGALPKRLQPGGYNVTLTFNQVGPYWKNDAGILERASFPILLSY